MQHTLTFTNESHDESRVYNGYDRDTGELLHKVVVHPGQTRTVDSTQFRWALAEFQRYDSGGALCQFCGRPIGDGIFLCRLCERESHCDLRREAERQQRELMIRERRSRQRAWIKANGMKKQKLFL